MSLVSRGKVADETVVSIWDLHLQHHNSVTSQATNIGQKDMASSSRQTTQADNASYFVQLTPEEEGKHSVSSDIKHSPLFHADTLIHNRITNDERPLRRLIRRFHVYTSVAYNPITPPPPSTPTSVEEVRESFKVELESFRMLLRKSRMVYDAEKRQTDVYRVEKQRIGE